MRVEKAKLAGVALTSQTGRRELGLAQDLCAWKKLGAWKNFSYPLPPPRFGEEGEEEEKPPWEGEEEEAQRERGPQSERLETNRRCGRVVGAS